MKIPINQRIANTDLFVFSKDSETGLYTYSRSFLDKREVEDLVIEANYKIDTEYGKADCFRFGGLRVDLNKNDIYGLCIFRGIVVNDMLMKLSGGNSRLPTIKEGDLMHRARMYVGDMCVVFGIKIQEGANVKEVRKLDASLKRNNIPYPVLVSFSSLGLKKGGPRYGHGVVPFLTSTEGILSGKAAERILEGFSFPASNNYLGINIGNRDTWQDTALNESCTATNMRITRITTIGTRGDLKKIAEEQIEGRFSLPNRDLRERIRGLQQKLDRDTGLEEKSRKSLRGILRKN